MRTTRFSGARVLVTGAGGFIGGHLVQALTDEGARVTALCRTVDESVSARLGVAAGVEARQAHLEDAGALRRIVAESRPDYLFHLGAVVDLERSAEMVDACARANVTGTANVLQGLAGSRLRRLVFTSTSEVYGDNSTPFVESQQERPPSPYAASKLAGEHFCLMFHRAFGCPVTVLRLSTVYGPGQSLQRLIPSAIAACLRQEALAVGDGEVRRDFVYVRDVVEGLLRAALCQEAVGEVINIGHEHGHSVREVIETVRRLAGPCPAPLHGEVPPRVGEARAWASNVDKARRLLGWEAVSDLETGLHETIPWYRRALGARRSPSPSGHMSR